MNYLAWVSNGVYGASDATERTNLFASWGIMDSLAALVAVSGGGTCSNIFIFLIK